MELAYFVEHLFDLLNESDVLNVQDIVSIENGYIVIIDNSTQFSVTCAEINLDGNFIG